MPDSYLGCQKLNDMETHSGKHGSFSIACKIHLNKGISGCHLYTKCKLGETKCSNLPWLYFVVKKKTLWDWLEGKR